MHNAHHMELLNRREGGYSPAMGEGGNFSLFFQVHHQSVEFGKLITPYDAWHRESQKKYSRAYVNNDGEYNLR